MSQPNVPKYTSEGVSTKKTWVYNDLKGPPSNAFLHAFSGEATHICVDAYGVGSRARAKRGSHQA
eukprot:scaffold113447_cov37-Prasinocladus_malaysianus.AAC.1